MSSNISLNRKKNISLSQRASIDHMNSRGDYGESKQSTHALPMGVNQYGINPDSFQNSGHNQYSSHNNKSKFFSAFLFRFIK